MKTANLKGHMFHMYKIHAITKRHRFSYEAVGYFIGFRVYMTT